MSTAFHFITLQWGRGMGVLNCKQNTSENFSSIFKEFKKNTNCYILKHWDKVCNFSNQKNTKGKEKSRITELHPDIPITITKGKEKSRITELHPDIPITITKGKEKSRITELHPDIPITMQVVRSFLQFRGQNTFYFIWDDLITWMECISGHSHWHS